MNTVTQRIDAICADYDIGDTCRSALHRISGKAANHTFWVTACAIDKVCADYDVGEDASRRLRAIIT